MGTGDGDVCVFVRGGAQYSVRVRGGEGGGDHDHDDDGVSDCFGDRVVEPKCSDESVVAYNVGGMVF